MIKNNSKILRQKEVYPYGYVSSISKFKETKLPPKEEFYSKLNNEDISDEDYQHAINVWNTFKCKTIRDYHDLYKSLMSYFWQMYLKTLEKLVLNITILTPLITIHLLVWLGMPV